MAAADRFLAGVVVVHPWHHETIRPGGGGSAYELLVGIRPVHRATGLATRFLKPVLREMRRTIDPGTLYVRYPAWTRGGGSAMAVDSWRGFFALYDFRDLPQADYADGRKRRREPNGEQVLKWTRPAPRRAGTAGETGRQFVGTPLAESDSR